MTKKTDLFIFTGLVLGSLILRTHYLAKYRKYKSAYFEDNKQPPTQDDLPQPSQQEDNRITIFEYVNKVEDFDNIESMGDIIQEPIYIIIHPNNIDPKTLVPRLKQLQDIENVSVIIMNTDIAAKIFDQMEFSPKVIITSGNIIVEQIEIPWVDWYYGE